MKKHISIIFAVTAVALLEGPDGPIDATLVTLGEKTPATAVPVVIDKAIVKKTN